MKTMRILGRIPLLVIVVIVLSINSSFAGAAANRSIYLPFIEKNARYGFGSDNKFIGVYMQQYWTDNAVATYMPMADNLANKKHSVTGWFIDIEDEHFVNGHPDLRTNNLYRQLEALWKYGYVSFLNINSTHSAYAIASGELDTYLGRMAEYYAAWVRLGGGRRAFLAPLPEMNGVNADGQPWTSYGGDPTNFKLAYQRIMSIFAQKGVSRDQVWWVFAPNGWSKAGHEFENYYPGNASVDTVAFSMYNYGYCQVANPWPKWENYDTLYAPYLARINSMAGNKPIIIAQTGTTAERSYTGDYNVSAKNTWLRVNYEYLANQPQLLGVLYYDIDQSSWECNWRITVGNTFSDGYRAAAAFPKFQYLTWQALEAVIP